MGAEQTAQTGKNSASVLFYFLLALLAAFLCTSGVLGYLYIAYIADSLRQTGSQADFLTRSFLLISLSWVLALGVFFLIARTLAKSIIGLKNDVIRLVRGEQGGELTTKGPREIHELADTLSKMIPSRK